MSKKPFIPFWLPWGAGGCLWRTLVFLAGIILLCFILSLFKGCNRSNNKPFDGIFNAPDSLSQYDPRRPWDSPGGTDDGEDPYRNLPPELRDTTPVDSWNRPIHGVPELPDSAYNYIPPISDDRIVPNPIDSLTQVVAGQLIVFFNSTDIDADMTSFAQQFKSMYPSSAYQVIYYNPGAATMLLSVPENRLIQTADEIESRITNMEYIITTNDVLSSGSVPSDPGFSVPKYDEYFKLIQAYDAWEVTKGDPSIKVAIVDTNFDLSNPELASRAVSPIHIPSKTRYVLPPRRMPANENELGGFCHGSHVAGIAIGSQNNGMGVSGIAPECTWIPVAVGEGPYTSLTLLEGILYAIYQGADVVNFSFGIAFPQGTSSLPLADQVAYSQSNALANAKVWDFIGKIANDHNCTIVTSSGNDNVLMGMDSKNRTNSIIKVEAVDGKGIAADFSNFGKVPEAHLDYSTVAAPGVDIWSATDKKCTPIWEQLGYTVDKANGLQEMSGTSMASPVVAGAVALLKSKNKDLTTEEIAKVLQMTGKQTDTQHRIGPTIQIADALNAVGGEVLNFDELMRNHDLLIGRWKATEILNLTDGKTNAKLDELWTYFTFPNTSSGTVEYRTLNSKRIYTAPVKVVWGTNTVTFIQTTDARSADGDLINKDDFVCSPDAKRLLRASAQRNGVERFVFYLQKVN